MKNSLIIKKNCLLDSETNDEEEELQLIGLEIEILHEKPELIGLEIDILIDSDEEEKSNLHKIDIFSTRNVVF